MKLLSWTASLLLLPSMALAQDYKSLPNYDKAQCGNYPAAPSSSYCGRDDRPGESSAGVGKLVNIGFRFAIEGNGLVTHVRYWKSGRDTGRVHVGRIYDAGNWQVYAETEPFGKVCGSDDYEGWVTIPFKTPFRTNNNAYVIAVDNVLWYGRTDNYINYPSNKVELAPKRNGVIAYSSQWGDYTKAPVNNGNPFYFFVDIVFTKDAPQPSYSSPSYSAPQPSYSAPQPSYSAPQPSYSAPQPSYNPYGYGGNPSYGYGGYNPYGGGYGYNGGYGGSYSPTYGGGGYGYGSSYGRPCSISTLGPYDSCRAEGYPYNTIYGCQVCPYTAYAFRSVYCAPCPYNNYY